MRLIAIIVVVTCLITTLIFDTWRHAVTSTSVLVLFFMFAFERKQKILLTIVIIATTGASIYANMPLIERGLAWVKKEKPDIKIQVGTENTKINLAEMPSITAPVTFVKPVLEKQVSLIQKTELKKSKFAPANTTKISKIKANLKVLVNKKDDWSLALSHEIRMNGVKFQNEISKPLNVIK